MGVRSPSFVVSGGAVPHACLSSSSSPPHSRKARGWGWRLHLPFCDTSTNYRWCSPRRRQISKRWTMGAAKKARRSCYLLIILRKDARSAISNRISATLLVPSSSAEKDEKFRSCVLRSRFHVWTRVSNGWMDGWMDEWMWSPPSLSLPPSPRTHGERMCQSLLQYSRPKRLTPSNFHTCLPSHPERAYLASDSLWWQAIILIRNHSQECN